MLKKSEIAKALGISRQALSQWSKVGCPVSDVLGWPLKDAVQYLRMWREDNKRPPGKAPAEATDGTLQQRLIESQIAKNNEDTRTKRLKNEEREGLLVDQQNAAQQMAEALTIMKARLETLADWIRREASADERERLAAGLDEQIHLALKECAAKMRSRANGTAA